MATVKLDPLREFLDAVVTRIETLEKHCGLSSGGSGSLTTGSGHGLQKTPSVKHLAGTGDTPSLKAYDKFMSSSVYKFADSCDDLGGMDNTGKLVVEVFEGMKYVLILASRSKQPNDMVELQPYLKPITDAVTKIRGLRLKRDYDNHIKAIMEMLTCVSWVTCRAPSQLPAPFVKECIGSADFWSNRIRKEYKGKDGDDLATKQIAFCDNLKKLLSNLASYIEEYHKTGVTFNPKGVSIAEAAIVLSDTPASAAAAAAAEKVAHKTKPSGPMGNVVKGGNVMGLMSELAGRRTGDGASAATGLKKVSMIQQNKNETHDLWKVYAKVCDSHSS